MNLPAGRRAEASDSGSIGDVEGRCEAQDEGGVVCMDEIGRANCHLISCQIWTCSP